MFFCAFSLGLCFVSICFYVFVFFDVFDRGAFYPGGLLTGVAKNRGHLTRGASDLDSCCRVFYLRQGGYVLYGFCLSLCQQDNSEIVDELR